MPNRIIKESICSSASIDNLNWFEEAMFYRLMVNCDDYGRFDGRPLILKSRLFPLKDNLTTNDILCALQKLVDVGCVALYEHDQQPYIYLPSWNKHQKIRNLRSKFPEPPNSNQSIDSNCIQSIANESACSRNPNQSESEIESERESESKSRYDEAGLCKTNKSTLIDLEFIKDDQLRLAFGEYIEHRRLMKKPMSHLAAEKAYLELTSLSNTIDDQIRILNNSIANGWQGLFPLPQNDRAINRKEARRETAPQNSGDMKSGFRDASELLDEINMNDQDEESERSSS